MIQLPKEFCQRMQGVLENEYDVFISSLNLAAPTSIHLHPIKGKHLSAEFDSASVPWFENGYYLDTRPSFTLDPLFHAGGYYVQEASSMLVVHALELVSQNNKRIKILDLCAAPGGKSTLISSILNGNGLLVSNEVISTRVPALKHNLTKWGYTNQIITSSDPEKFSSLTEYFDIILVDAPCSGEGLFRKDIKSRSEWTADKADQCALRQNRINQNILPTLKTGGHLIYSTCTYNPNENIEQIKKIVECGFRSVKMDLEKLGLVKIEDQNAIGYQVYPHRAKGEGFFISLLHKINELKYETLNIKSKHIEWIISPSESSTYLSNSDFAFFKHNDSINFFPGEYVENLEKIGGQIRIISAGTDFGIMKGRDLIPAHALSQSVHLHSSIPTIDLNREDAIQYLKKNTLPNIDNDKGYLLASYKSLPMGWLKSIPGRYNNLYPNEYRIMGKFE